MREEDFYKNVKIIDDAIATGIFNPLLIKLIKNESYSDYFFKTVRKIEWFDILHKEGYFSPKNAPAPFEAKEKGLFTIPEWNVLPYLETISKQVDTPGNETYIDELLKIIKEVSNYRDRSGQHIDNYRTWYYFVEILINLPNRKITEEIVDLIPIWLDSRFSTSLPGSEIAEKLLPKFLNSSDPSDWIKAGRIVEIITDIKWVQVPEKQRSIYEKDKEPRTLVEPHWLIKAFEKNAERIGEVCSVDVIYGVAKRILDILRREHPHSYDIGYDGKNYQITHALLEDGKHEILLYSLKYPDDWDGYSREKIEKTLMWKSDISEYTGRKEFVAAAKKILIDKSFPLLTDEFDKALASIYSFYDYTYISFNSLVAPPDIPRLNDAERSLIYILRSILLSKSRSDKEMSKIILNKFLSREYPYPIFTRLVLFIVGNEWEKYKEYFFRMIDESEEIKYFEKSNYATELQFLLKDNMSKFTSAEKEVIKQLIIAGPKEIPSDDPEKYVGYWKQKWLSLLKDDPEFAALFEGQKKITGIDKEKFTFGTEFKISKGFGPSPLSTEEILKMTNNELALRMREFKSEKDREGKTVEGFSAALKDAVAADPNKFVENLDPFKEVGFIYVYKIIDGVKDAWKTRKEFNWGKLFDFIDSYIQKDQFWKDELVVEKGEWLGGADHQWIIGIIAELIEEGTRDDSWAFNEDHFDKVKRIIFYLLREPEEDKEITDYVTYTLNTPCGKLISSLVNMTLRIARVNDKKGIKAEPRWSEEYKNKFDEILGKKIIEAYTSLGRFLPNFYYLDKNWVGEKIEQVSTQKESKYWEALMDGYLSVGAVDDELYELMKPHYQYGLSHGLKEKRNQEHLVQHVCIGYLRDQERLDDPSGLFTKIIDAWKHEQLLEIIGFFWMQRDYLREASEENEEIKKKIIEFWKLLYERYKGKDERSLSHEDKLILSTASELTALLPSIDEESYKWLMLSAPHVSEDFRSSFFIEYLDEIKDKGYDKEAAKYIGGIYLKMLEKVTPDHDKKHIRSIVEFLYNAGAQENANMICNIYGSRGYEFLRDIYEKHAKST